METDWKVFRPLPLLPGWRTGKTVPLWYLETWSVKNRERDRLERDKETESPLSAF